MPARTHEHSGFFVLRTSLLPFEEFFAWSAGLEAASCPGPELDVVWEREMRLLQERLRRLLCRPEVREAIAIASPDLEERARPWLDGNEAAVGDDLVLALGRYFTRMTARSTPFGLFAGNSIGRIGESGQLRLAERACYRRHTRLDMDYLSALAQALGAHTELRRELTYRANSSLYEAAGRLRYSEARMSGRERRYHLVALEVDEPLATVLEEVQQGARHAELVESLAHDGITPEEAASYLDELIEAQVLVPDLEPPLTGQDALPDVVERLEATMSGRQWTPALAKVRQALSALDAHGPGANPERYRQIATVLATLPAKADLARLFQVDLVKPVKEAELPSSILDEVWRGVEALLRLYSDVLGRESETFATFRQQFTDRYGEREVPLLEVLDEEVGIGFMPATGPNAEASPLLDGLVFPPKPPEPGRPWSRAHAFILPHLARALESHATEISLQPRDLEGLPAADFSRLPDSIAVVLKVFAAAPEALRSGAYRILLHNIAGPSGARLLGRFCYMDPDLCEHVRHHLQQEEQLLPEAIFAEIVHLPEGRTGNILARPLLRGFEIPFLGRSGALAERQLPLQDLRLSVSGNRIVLRSARLGREIVPRLTTAHNFTLRTVRAYQFLCRLQSQHCIQGVSWNWGPLERQPFLPAIRLGRVILEPATWYLDAKDLRALAAKSGAAGFTFVQRLREERRMPRFVGLADGDNVLPLDLDNAVSVATLMDLLAKRSFCVLREIEASVEQLLATGPEGHFLHEIVLPLVRSSRTTSPETKARSGPRHQVAPAELARLGPGTAWVYFKLYTGTATAEGILRQELPELLQWCRQAGVIDRWFFLRYSDPGFHLRVRLRAPSAQAQREVVARAETIFSDLVSQGRVWRLQLDTYDPERARYGGALGLDLSERWFEADSEAALQVLALTEGDTGANHRWRLCLAGMDRLLDDLGFDVAAKHAILLEVATEHDREFRVEGRFKRQIRDRYRLERPVLEALLERRRGIDAALGAGLTIFRQRSQALLPVVAALRLAEQDGTLEQPLRRLAGSYLHMHANRMLRSVARAQETVLYHFLERLYDSRLARLRQTVPTES